MRYDSFRLRVWRSIRLGRTQWSARLEELKDGQATQFASLAALVAHLRGAARAGGPRTRPHSGSGRQRNAASKASTKAGRTRTPICQRHLPADETRA